MTHPVFEALLPVVLLIALGYCVGRKGWVGAAATKDLSNLVFLVLAPALLFRTMSGVRVQDIDFRPVLVYFGAMWLVFGAVLWRLGLTRRAAVLGLAATFSNTLMIGVPLVGLAYGQQGLVTLFALVSLHAFVMLTMVTVVLEFAVLAEQQRAACGASAAAAALRWPARLRKLALTVARAGRASLLHPVPLPILCGLLFAQTGLPLPGVIERPLQLLGAAFGPVALLLVGISLAGTALGGHWRAALGLMLMKNLLHPLVLALLGLALGFAGVPFAVMVLAASLPIGANVYLYAMRYLVAEQEVTAAIALSTMLGVATVALVMALVPYLP